MLPPAKKTLRSSIAILLCFVLVVLSPGIGCYSALAQSRDGATAGYPLADGEIKLDIQAIQANAGVAGISREASHGTAVSRIQVYPPSTSLGKDDFKIKIQPLSIRRAPSQEKRILPATNADLVGRSSHNAARSRTVVTNGSGDAIAPIRSVPRQEFPPVSVKIGAAEVAIGDSKTAPEADAAAAQFPWDGTGKPTKTAGAAFGVGDNYTIRRHAEANAVWQEAFAESRTRTVYEPGGHIPPSTEHAVFMDTLDQLRHLPETPAVSVEGLKTPIQWKDALIKEVRIIVGDFDSPAPIYESGDNLEVLHNGFGGKALNHAVPSILGDSRVLNPNIYDAASRLGMFINDYFQLAAKTIAKAEDVPWTEELSAKVHAASRQIAESAVPNLTENVRRIIQKIIFQTPSITRNQARKELLELGISADRLEEFLSPDPAAQQFLLNRAAALVSKGFPQEAITPALIAAQTELDHFLETAPSTAGQTLDVLQNLLKSNPKAFRRLTKNNASLLQNQIDGHPFMQKPEAGAHSQVAGLALRLDKAMAAGRSIDPLAATFRVKPEVLRWFWSLWSDPKKIGEIPSIKIPRSGGKDLAGVLQESEKKIVSDRYLLDKEKRHLKHVAINHPIVRRLLTANKAIERRRKQLIAYRKALPKNNTVTGEELDKLRETKNRIKNALSTLLRAKKNISKRISDFQKKIQTDEMAQLSLAVLKWLPSARGFSVVLDPNSNHLEVLIISSDKDAPLAPKELDASQLQQLTQGKFEISGIWVSARWFEESPSNWFRNREVAKHAIRGISLGKFPINDVADQIPIREMWPWVVEELAEAESLISASGDATELGKARIDIEQASSFLAVTDLELNNEEYGSDLFQAIRAGQRAGDFFDEIAKRNVTPQEKINDQKAALRAGIDSLKRGLDAASLKGRVWSLERELEQMFYSQNPAARLGQLAVIRARTVVERPTHETSAEQARQKMEALRAEAPTSANAEARLNRALKNTAAYNDWWWQYIPTDVVLGKEFEIKGEGFRRPIHVTVYAGKINGPLNELAVIAANGPGRYTTFFNETLFELDPDAQRAAIGQWAQMLSNLQNEGCSVSEAEDKMEKGSSQLNTSPVHSDRELIDNAVRDYDSGIRFEDLVENNSIEALAMRRAQAVSDFMNAEHNNLSGAEVLVGWAPGENEEKTQALRSAAEKMAEVFAGNNIHVRLARAPTGPTWMASAMRRSSSYAAGFLVTDAPDKYAIAMFGPEGRHLPQRITAPITDLENNRNVGQDMDSERARLASGRRMDLEKARLARLISEVDWLENDRVNLLHNFRIEEVRKKGVQVILDTPRAELASMLRSQGLLASAFDGHGNPQLLRDAVLASGGKRIGARILENGQVQIVVDTDGKAVSPQDLSIVFTDYSLAQGTYQGPIYRTSGQTRLLDRIADKWKVGREVLDNLDSNLDADSLVLSPKTPWSDARSQILLAMEIVSTKGKSLKELATELRQSLGPTLQARREHIELDADFLQKLWSATDPQGLAEFFKVSENGLANANIRKIGQGIQVELGEDWIYIKRGESGLELFTESSQKDRAEQLIHAVSAYVKNRQKEAKPSASLRFGFIAFAAVVAALGAMLIVGTFAPDLLLNIPVIGQISQFANLLRDAGVWLLHFVIRPPFILNKLIKPFGFVANYFVLYYVILDWLIMRLPAWLAYKGTLKKVHDLDSSLHGIPYLQERINNMDAFSWPVWISKDGSFRITPGLRRLPQWMQPVYYTYFAIKAKTSKIYMDRAVNVRQVVNSKGQVLIRALAELPPTFRQTIMHGFLASRASVAGMGLPRHLMPDLSPTLPEPLREHVGSFYAAVSGPDNRPNVKDSDTFGIKLFVGGDDETYVRLAGMDAVENDQAGFRETKKFCLSLLKHEKKPLFLPLYETLADGSKTYKRDKYGRVLAYVYVHDRAGRLFCVNLRVLNEYKKRQLVTTDTGGPDDFIANYYYLDLQTPHASLGPAKLQPNQQPLEGPGLSAWNLNQAVEPILDDAIARAVLKENGGEIDPSARLVLSTKFAGERGEFLKEKVGAITMEHDSQLIVMGDGPKRLGNPHLFRKASLQLSNLGNPSAIVFNDGMKIDGDVIIRAEKGIKRLTVEAGTVFKGNELGINHPLVLSPGSETTIKMTRGRLDILRDHPHPEEITKRLWNILRGDGDLSSLLSDPTLEGLDLNAVKQWWRHALENGYGKVRLPRKASPNNLVKKLRAPQNFKFRLPASPQQGREMVEHAHDSLLSSMRSKKYLLRNVRGERKIKQALLAGLANYYQTRVNRLQEAMNAAWTASQTKLEEAVSEINKGATADFGKTLGVDGIRKFMEDANRSATEQERLHGYFNRYAPNAWTEIIRLGAGEEELAEARRQLNYARGSSHKGKELAIDDEEDEETPRDLMETAASANIGELERRLQFIENRLAALGGLLWWGPQIFNDAVSVIAAGPYLWSEEAPTLKLYVVRKGDRGPEPLQEYPAGYEKIPWPEDPKSRLHRLEIEYVGEDWLKGGSPKASDILTECAALGLTLWGQDLIGLSSQDLPQSSAKIDQKIPARNLLALTSKLLAGDLPEKTKLDLLNLILMSVNAGVFEMDADLAANKAAIENWVLKQELQDIVKRWLERRIAKPYEGGVGGLVVGNFTDGRPWHTLSAEESINWIQKQMREGAPVENADKKLKRAYARAKHKTQSNLKRKGWLIWYPSEEWNFPEEGQFQPIGYDRTGRLVEVRVSVRELLGKEASPHRFIAYAIAPTDPADAGTGHKKYVLMLENIFLWPPSAQDRIFDDIAFQLKGLLEGKSPNDLREANLMERENLNRIRGAVAGVERGVTIKEFEKKPLIPWNPDGSGWEGALEPNDLLRVAQGLARYMYSLSTVEAGKNSKHILIGSAKGDDAGVIEMAQVLAGNKISSGILQKGMTLEEFNARLEIEKNQGYVLGVWIGENTIKIYDQNGRPLDNKHSRDMAVGIMQAESARLLDLHRAHELNLIVALDSQGPVPKP